VLLFDEGRLFEARVLCRAALEFFALSPLHTKTALCHLLLARIDLRLGDPRGAHREAEEAWAHLADRTSPVLTYHASLLLGDAAAGLGDRDRAHDAYQTAREALETTLRSGIPGEELKIPFAAVATSLENGAEIWLRKGSTMNAVRASLAMPGLFTPVLTDDGILVDGALVNPVPVSLARAMGAEIVIAVDLSYGIVGRSLVVRNAEAGDADEGGWLRKSFGRLWPVNGEPRPPALLDVIASSLDIMQVRITRSRMAGEPPDIIVAPRLAHIGLLDFDRAEEAIREGERAMEAALGGLAVLGIEAGAG